MQAYVDDSVKSYTAASSSRCCRMAVVISQFQTAAAAGQPPDIRFLERHLHMEACGWATCSR